MRHVLRITSGGFGKRLIDRLVEPHYFIKIGNGVSRGLFLPESEDTRAQGAVFGHHLHEIESAFGSTGAMTLCGSVAIACKSEDRRIAPALFLGACALFSLAIYGTFACATGVFPSCQWFGGAGIGGVSWNQIGLCLWWGLAMNHYYLDQKIWRIRGDAALKRSLRLA